LGTLGIEGKIILVLDLRHKRFDFEKRFQLPEGGDLCGDFGAMVQNIRVSQKKIIFSDQSLFRFNKNIRDSNKKPEKAQQSNKPIKMSRG
jgi:hypothetical protein